MGRVGEEGARSRKDGVPAWAALPEEPRQGEYLPEGACRGDAAGQG